MITTLNAEQIDRIPSDVLADVLGIDLRDYSSDRADAGHVAEWIEDSEQRTWQLPTYALLVGTERVILWTLTDEAGVADVSVAETEEDLDVQVREYAEELASDLGHLVQQ